jgi:hypothetical protein
MKDLLTKQYVKNCKRTNFRVFEPVLYGAQRGAAPPNDVE